MPKLLTNDFNLGFRQATLGSGRSVWNKIASENRSLFRLFWNATFDDFERPQRRSNLLTTSRAVERGNLTPRTVNGPQGSPLRQPVSGPPKHDSLASVFGGLRHVRDVLAGRQDGEGP